MCGGTPNVQRRDLQAEQLQAERVSTEKANAEIAYRKARRAKSSLISNIGGAAGLSAISIPVGKDTLG